MPGRNSRAWLAVAILCLAILAVIDIATSGTFARSLYLLPVLAIAIRAPAGDVALAGVAATALGIASPIWNDTFGESSLLPVITIVSGSVIAAWGARERRVAEDARSAAETERSQLLLLAEAARITDGAAHIDEALRRLVDLLVPEIADAAWVDVIGSDGEARRIAARYHGERVRGARGVAHAARRGEPRRPLPHHARAARRGRPARRAHARPARGHEPRRRRQAPDAALAPALDDGDPARAERRPARRPRPRRRRLGPVVRRARPAVRHAAGRACRPRARQRPARGPAHGDAAAARRHPRLARRGRHGAGHARPHGLRQRGRRAAAQAPRRAGRAHRRPGRPRRALRDPPSRRQPGPDRGAAGLPRALRRAAGSAPHAEHLPRHRPGPLVPDQGHLARGRDGRPAGGERDRGRDRGARGGAARALPRRGRAGARLLARLPGHAAADGAARGARPGRLVRDRAARRPRPAPAGRARPRRPASASRPAARCASTTRPTPTRRPARRR